MTDTQRTYYIITGRDSHDAPYQLSVSAEDKEFRYILSAFRVSAAAPISSTEALTAVMAHAAGRDIMLATVTQLIPRPATADEKLDAARAVLRAVLRADYWQDVQDVVANLRDEIEAGNIDDADAARDWINDTVDGHQRVIYTGQAIECLLFSRNEGAYEDEMGEPLDLGDGDGDHMMWSRLAYHAFRADILHEIGDLDALFTVEPEDEAECYVCGEPFNDEDGLTEVTNFGGEGRHRSHVTCPDETEDNA